MGISGSFDLDVTATVAAEVDVGASIGFGATVGFGAGIGLGAGMGPGPPPPAMAIGGRKDPFLSYNFAVEIEGLVAGGFSEVSGLQTEIEVQEYREGGVNEYIHKRAGPAKYSSNLVLKKGITDVRTLWSWYWDVAQGKIERKNVSVLLMDSAGQEKLRWNFEKAYPVKWVGPDLKGVTSEVAVEAVELAHNGLAKG